MGRLLPPNTPRFATAALLLLAIPAAWAQDNVRLSAAVEAALAHAPEAAAAEASIRVGDAGLGVARQRPNPSLALEAENFDGTGPFSGSRLRESTATLELPLEIGGKRGARILVAKAEQSAIAADVDAAQADIVASTTEAFVRVVEAERRATLAAKRLELAEQGFKAAQTRVRAGKASPLEEQRAEVERTNARTEADATGRKVENARQTLARWTGLQVASVSAPWFDETPVEAEAAIAGAPALVKADAELTAAQARTRLAQRSRIPDLTLGAGMRRFNETDDTAMVVALTVPIPVLNSGAADVRLARAQEDRAQALRDAARLGFERDLAQARLEVQDARAAADAANGPALAAATEAARIARIGYREGKFSQLDLIDAERSLNLTQVAAIDALAAFHLARARLAQLQGLRAPLSLE